MNSLDFAYWLKGFFEISGESKSLNETQVQIIKEHLDLVFEKYTPTSMSSDENFGTCGSSGDMAGKGGTCGDGRTIPDTLTQKILCGNANKFYRCVTCDAPCGSEGHYVEVTEEPKHIIGTISYSEWSAPERVDVIDTGRSIEMVYVQNRTVVYGAVWLDKCVFKIVYSCENGEWHKSEPIYGKIMYGIPAQEEYYEFPSNI